MLTILEYLCQEQFYIYDCLTIITVTSILLLKSQN